VVILVSNYFDILEKSEIVNKWYNIKYQILELI
jgi:hypothetical protein